MSYEQVYLGLLNRGMTSREAAAFAANAGVESSFNPAAVNRAGGGQGAHGLFQWRGNRYGNLQASSDDYMSMDPQLDFVVQEYRNDPQNAWGGVCCDHFLPPPPGWMPPVNSGWLAPRLKIASTCFFSRWYCLSSCAIF